MSGNATNDTVTSVGIDATVLYGDLVEPFLCIIYSFIIIKASIPLIFIKCSPDEDLRSPFFTFSITTGFSAILNILCNLVTRLIDIRFHIMLERGLLLNILSCFSHIFAFSMTLGKILSVTTRFTSVWMPFKFKEIWSPFNMRIIITLQFLLPFAMFAYMPFMKPVFAPTSDGYGHYLGIATVPFKIAKGINMLGYLLFFVTTIPMCVATVVKMMLDRRRIAASTQNGPPNGCASRNERVLVLASVVLTLAHAIKATQQSIWFIALLMNEPSLQATMISIYMIPNAVTSFAEPVLLLISSKSLRREIFGPCTKKTIQESNTMRFVASVSRMSR